MATIGHLAAGLAVGRVHLSDRPDRARTLLVFGALGVLPDLDLLGRLLHVPMATPLGHRGAAHSLVFALATGLLAALLSPRLGWSRLRTGLLAAAAVATHGALDAISAGHLGIAFLWPLSDQRFHAPFGVIPAALPSFVQVRVAALAVEALLFAPLAALALWPRRRRVPPLEKVRWLGGSPEAAQRLRAWRASIQTQIAPERRTLG